MNRSFSVERLTPHFGSAKRSASVSSAVTNLVSTIIGGGVLSLPFALQRGGLIPGIVLLLVVAVASDFSVYTLISCSRRSGADSFGDVAEVAFGRWAKIGTMVIIISVTYVPAVAYTILLRDLLTPIVEEYLLDDGSSSNNSSSSSSSSSGGMSMSMSSGDSYLDVYLDVYGTPAPSASSADGMPGEGGELSPSAQNLMALVLLLLISPFCLLSSLDKLKAASLGCVASIMLLAAAVLTRAVGTCRNATDVPWGHALSGPREGWMGALQGLPIFVCAFVCHFNVLPLHGELHRPSRRRLHRLVHWTMFNVAIFYLGVGVSGYFYGLCVGHLTDNILNDFDPDDVLVNVGRLGLVLTILLGFPLMVVPCRETMLGLWAELRKGKGEGEGEEEGEGKQVAVEEPLLPSPSPSPSLCGACAAVALAAGGDNGGGLARASLVSSELEAGEQDGGGGGSGIGEVFVLAGTEGGGRHPMPEEEEEEEDGHVCQQCGVSIAVMAGEGVEYVAAREESGPLVAASLRKSGGGGDGGGGGRAWGGRRWLGWRRGRGGAVEKRGMGARQEGDGLKEPLLGRGDDIEREGGQELEERRAPVGWGEEGKDGLREDASDSLSDSTDSSMSRGASFPREAKDRTLGSLLAPDILMERGEGSDGGGDGYGDGSGRVIAFSGQGMKGKGEEEQQETAAPPPSPPSSMLVHVALTYAILLTVVGLASVLTRVTDVWGLLGSSFNTLVAFVIPCACYLKIRKYHRPRKGKRFHYVRKRMARILLWSSTVLGIVCFANQLYVMASR